MYGSQLSCTRLGRPQQLTVAIAMLAGLQQKRRVLRVEREVSLELWEVAMRCRSVQWTVVQRLVDQCKRVHSVASERAVWGERESGEVSPLWRMKWCRVCYRAVASSDDVQDSLVTR